LCKSYQKKTESTPRQEIDETLEQYIRDGARRMLALALEEEVNAFLGRDRYARHLEFRGYRNGYLPKRQITVGLAPVEVRVPRVSNVPERIDPQGFHSQIVRKYQRASDSTRKLFTQLYLEGLATGDFGPVFRELVGETTAVSPSAIVRLKQAWEKEYRDWRKRQLGGQLYLYIWGDGIYLKAGMEKEKTALLCIIGAREDGAKELLAMESGYRESTQSWVEVLQDLRSRGLDAPLLAIGDGGLGLWAGLEEIYPETEHQRCWNHRIMNVQDKLPKRLQAEARSRLREISEAPTQRECEALRDNYVADLIEIKQKPAAETILRDWEDFVTFYHYPQEHWVHLRTSNPLESIFGGVRIRTNAARRIACRENALYLVFKIVKRLSQTWRNLNGVANLMQLLLDGRTFKDGKLESLTTNNPLGIKV